MRRIGLMVFFASALVCGTAAAAEQVAVETLTAEQRAQYERGATAVEEAGAAQSRPRMSEIVRRAGEAIENADAVAPIDMEAIQNKVDSHADRARALVEPAQPKGMPDLKALFQGSPWASQAEQIASEELGKAEKEKPSRYVLLATRAMGATRLREALRLSRERSDYVVVFRGPAPGQKLPELIQELAGLMALKEGEQPPNVMVDPTRFEGEPPEAPVLMRLDDEGKVVARVSGLLNPQWIEDRIARGDTGDLGRFGEVTEVVEEDMIKVMQRQLADYDMEQKTKDAYLGYFERVKLPALEEATEDRERLWDPSVVLKDAITMPDGGVAAYPGTRVNPMQAVGFAMTLIFFDARDPAQIAWAREEIAQRDGQKVYAIATAFDGKKGWKGLGEVMTTLNSRVFHTNPLLVERFGIQKVPSMVTAGPNYKLLIREFSVERLRQRFASKDEHGGSDDGTGTG